MNSFLKAFKIKLNVNSECKPEGSDLAEIEVKPCTEPVFFMHIPKTAGTSFKKAAIEYFGESGVIKNYGEKSIETSPLVHDKLLSNRNFAEFDKALQKAKASLYMGHVHVNSARFVFPSNNIFTILRDPVGQVISHYNHYVRWYNYKGSVDEFLETKGFQNLQFRYLQGMPIYLMGLIGLTERYAESIELYNQIYHTNLSVKAANANNKKLISDVDEELLKRVLAHNQQDVLLYKKVERLFDQRYKFHKSNKAWCHGYVHRYEKERNMIFGVAYDSQSNTPVEVGLYAGDKIIETTIANSYRPGFAQWNIPNFNHVGFQFKLGTQKFNDYKVKVLDTGQELMFDV